jgi:hypothetical protein
MNAVNPHHFLVAVTEQHASCTIRRTVSICCKRCITIRVNESIKLTACRYEANAHIYRVINCNTHVMAEQMMCGISMISFVQLKILLSEYS